MAVIIRVDGRRETGLGHLVRSTALARTLLARGTDVVLLTRSPETTAEFAPEACTIDELDGTTAPFSLAEAEAVAQSITDRAADGIVVDSFEATTEYQSRVREETPLCLVLDDYRHTLDCDILLNGHIYAEQTEYEYRDEPTWCLGPEYLLIRRVFRQEPAYEADTETVRVLVTMGGSDPTDTSPVAIEALDGLEIAVDVIIGPGFDNVDRIHQASAAVDTDITLHEMPSNLPDLMYRSDIAVSATGTTTYELLAAGTAVVGLPRIKNQELIAESLHDAGVIRSLGRDVSRSEIHGTVQTLLEEPAERRRLQTAGREVVDGTGPERVAAIITEEFSV